MADISFKALELHNSAIKELDKYNYEQEHRQLRLKEKILKITVNVSRQDFPAISSDVDIFYTPTASQAAWTVFLADVRTKLNIEFVDQIIDRGTLNTVHRTLSLRNGAQYFVRQREESSVLEVLNSNATPVQIVWPITKHMVSAKQRLGEIESMQSEVDQRVDTLIKKPQGRMAQVATSKAILAATEVATIISAVTEIMLPKPEKRISGLADGDSLLATHQGVVDASENKNLGSRKPLDDGVDAVSLYRLTLESLCRLVQSREEKATVCSDVVLDFICECVEDFRDQIDIVVPSLQLLAMLLPFMIADLWKRKMIHTIMDTMQYYSPPANPRRPRLIKRLVPTPEEREEMLMGDEDKISKALNVVWRAEYKEMMRLGGRKKQKQREERARREAERLNSLDLSASSGSKKSGAAASGGIPLKSALRKDTRPPSREITPPTNARKITNTSHVTTLTFEGASIKDNDQLNAIVETNFTGNDYNGNDGNDETENIYGTINETETMSPSKKVILSTEALEAFKNRVEHQDKNKTRIAKEFARSARAESIRLSQELQFSKTSFQNGVFQSRDFKKTELLDDIIAKKTWKGEFVAKRMVSRDGLKRLADMVIPVEDPNAFHLKPLPVLSGVKFRGLSGQMDKDVALTQCMATIFKFISVHNTNRLLAFRMNIHNEICEIGLVCQGKPKLLEYIIWSIDLMMLDHIEKFPDEAASMSTMFGDKSLMQLSDASEIEKQARRAKLMNIDDIDERGEVGSQTGREIDEMSTVTMQSTEEFHMLTYKENLEVERAATKKSERRKKKKEAEEAEEDGGFAIGPDMRSNAARASVVPVEVRVKLAKAAEESKKKRKQFVPEEPEFWKPSDTIILCFAMVSGHGDLEPQEKELANKWLNIWDDGSRRYRMLLRQGVNIAGL